MRFRWHGQINCKLPWAILGCVEGFAFVMLFDALIDVFGKANVIALRMRYGTNDVNVKHAVRRRSAEAELWRTALLRQGLNTLFDLGSPEAGVPAVAPAIAGRTNDVNVTHGSADVRLRPNFDGQPSPGKRLKGGFRHYSL